MSPSQPLRVALFVLICLATFARSQVTVPTFGTRGDVPEVVVASFMTSFRDAVAARSGLEVDRGELITAGIASSLDPALTMLIIAELEGTRYALSGEISRGSGDETSMYMISLIVVDAVQERSSDVLSASFDIEDLVLAASELAEQIAVFVAAASGLPEGDAELWVSSQPGQAELRVNGVPVGFTSQLEVLALAEGRYEIEVRKEGFLPETRMLELTSGETQFLNIRLTPIAAGSILVSSHPRARVRVDGIDHGWTPVAVEASVGEHEVQLERDGFETSTLSVRVRDFFRVTRVQEALTPLTDPLLFWDEERPYLVFIGGVLQPGGYAVGIGPGLLDIDIRIAGEIRSYLRALPDSGTFLLDLESGQLIRFDP